ncbi:MAG: polysaccharide deacetylase family protein [Candidatus Omnitrophica bacterium]|nr:polysaccharide deacetylase family protein [Candidatus Omnitrophota bacterium]
MRLQVTRKSVVVATFLIIAIVIVLYAKAQYVVPIIMYHKIDGNSATSRLSVSPESFKAQMRFLKNQHYNVVKLEDLAEMVRENRLPSKTIAITFDDGYEDNYLYAYPVLKELGLSATIFIIPAMVGSDGYLTWDQVVDMSESGIVTIGNHSLSHSWLTSLAVQKLDSEIVDSKRSIESHIRKDVNTFSYPLGGFNKDVRERVIEAGYKIAVATNPGKRYPKHDLFAMKRLRISSTSDNLFVFWFEITGFYTWIKEHRDKD